MRNIYKIKWFKCNILQKSYLGSTGNSFSLAIVCQSYTVDWMSDSIDCIKFLSISSNFYYPIFWSLNSDFPCWYLRVKLIRLISKLNFFHIFLSLVICWWPQEPFDYLESAGFGKFRVVWSSYLSCYFKYLPNLYSIVR